MRFLGQFVLLLNLRIEGRENLICNYVSVHVYACIFKRGGLDSIVVGALPFDAGNQSSNPKLISALPIFSFGKDPLTLHLLTYLRYERDTN